MTRSSLNAGPSGTWKSTDQRPPGHRSSCEPVTQSGRRLSYMAMKASKIASGLASITRSTLSACPFMMPSCSSLQKGRLSLAGKLIGRPARQASAIGERPVVEVRLGQDLHFLVVLQHVDPRLAVALLEQDALRAHDVAGVEVLRIGPRPDLHVLVLRAQRGDHHGGALVPHVRQQPLD